MAETNGNRDTRMDRIEKALELLISGHEQFRQDHKQLLIAQVVQSDQIAQVLRVTEQHTLQIEALDKRVDKLVSSIGDLIARIPPATLSRLEI
jgi:bisphosphoglycerate-independent phosphoglycerate mutase (AlkP superfamily)